MPVSVIDYPTSLPTARQTLAGEVPTTNEDVMSEDVYLECAIFNVSGSTTSTITLSDKQGTAVQIFRVDVDAKAPVVLNPAKRIFFKGGLTWVASATGLNGYMVLSK